MKRVLLALVGMAILFQTALAGNWWETVKVKGDLRYRHEVQKYEETDARHRHRLRARLGVYGEVNDQTTIGIRLASGGESPVSTNQTLDGAFSTKPIGLDLAYFKTSCKFVDGLTITAGKFKNPFFKPGKSQLIWDSDWNPEGASLQYATKSDKLAATLIGSGLWIDERSSGDDSWLGALQGVLKFQGGEDQPSIAVGAGMFNYVNTKGYTPFYNSKSMGNSMVYDTTFIEGSDPAEVESIAASYATEFELIELFAEVSHKVGKMPVMVMFDYVTNSAADSLNTGWLVGLRVGKAKKPGSWSVRYVYRNLEADAVLGTFGHSDFSSGGTDAKGHEVGCSFMFDQNAAVKVSYYDNSIGLEGDGTCLRRLQVDLQMAF